MAKNPQPVKTEVVTPKVTTDAIMTRTEAEQERGRQALARNRNTPPPTPEPNLNEIVHVGPAVAAELKFGGKGATVTGSSVT